MHNCKPLARTSNEMGTGSAGFLVLSSFGLLCALWLLLTLARWSQARAPLSPKEPHVFRLRRSPNHDRLRSRWNRSGWRRWGDEPAL